MVDFVAVFETTQDADGIFNARLGHEDRLEAAFERSILLDVLAVFIQGRGADHMELAPGQHGFEHVAGVHSALCGAGSNDGVQLIHEEDDLARRVGDFLEHRLKTLLELAPVLGAGHQGPDVELHDAFVLKTFGHIAIDNALSEAFNNGGLAHTGLSDECGVVLGASRDHLDNTADLFIAPDHGVQFPLAGELGKIPSEFFEGLEGILRRRAHNPLRAPDFCQDIEDLLRCNAEGLQALGLRAGGQSEQ